VYSGYKVKTSVTNKPLVNNNTDIEMSQDDEEEEESDTDPEYVPATKHISPSKTALISRRINRRRASPYDCTVPQSPSSSNEKQVRQRTNISTAGIKVKRQRQKKQRGLYSRALYIPSSTDLPLSTAALQILQEFQTGPKPNESLIDHQEHILNSVIKLIIEHIQNIGTKIRTEADGKSRPGDYLSRMKGCLRNAALGLYLAERIRPTDTNLDVSLLRIILECVPPASTRPATKRVDSKLQVAQARLGVSPERQIVEVYWTTHLLPEDRTFMRLNASKWPGHWERLGL